MTYKKRGLCDECGRPRRVMMKSKYCYVCQQQKMEKEKNDRDES